MELEVERSYKVVIKFNMNGVVKELQQQVSRKTSLASSVFTQPPPPTHTHVCMRPLAQGNLPFFCLSSFQILMLDCLCGICHRDLSPQLLDSDLFRDQNANFSFNENTVCKFLKEQDTLCPI